MLYNIGAYLRISIDDKNKNESESIVNQKNIINSFINSSNELKNSNIYYYKDDGYSGSSFQRPAIKNLIEDVKNKKINCIIVKDLSRFGRNYIEVSDYLYKIFPFLNVRFIAINDNYDSKFNKDGLLDLDVAFKNILHSYYLKDLSKKSMTSKRILAERGCYISSYAPFGYRKNKETKRLEIVEEQAEIVRMIFELIVKGNNYVEVCKILNSKNIPVKSDFKVKNGERKVYSKKNDNKIWKSQDIVKIISDEVYIGNTINFKRKRVKCGSLKTIKSSEDEIVKVENTHKAIISKEIFYKTFPKKKESTSSIVKSIFAFKIKCDCCGYALRKREVYRNKNKENKYFCKTIREKEELNCSREPVFENDLKKLVFEKFKEQISIRYNSIDNTHNIDTLKNSILFYENEISKSNTNRMKKYEDYIEGIILKEEYINIKNELEVNINSYLSKIKKIKKDLDILLEQEKELCLIRKYLNSKELTKDMVDEFVKCIYVNGKDNIRIEWNFEN